MSKYSDHSTIGGQVLAHRIRMIRQNANIIWIAGRIGFVIFFFGYLFTKCGLGYTWNYLCCLKASFRVALRFLPNNFLDSSYFFMEKGWWKYVSDYTLTHDAILIKFKNEFENLLIYNLKISGIFAVFVMIAIGIIHKRLGKKLTDRKELISGHNYVTGKELKKLVKDKSDITLAGISYPKGAEARHTLITGTTGSGKTNVIIELIDQVQALGERAIIVDTVGTYVNRYYNPDRGDIILNPLDLRSVPWSFLEECDCDTLLRNVASCLIDKGGDHDRFWEDAAKIVFVETAKKIKKDKKSLDEFIDVLLKTPLDEMQKYLEGSYGASLIDKNADKMALSIRATLINAVHIFDVLREDSDNNFSIKKWIEGSTGGFLFLSCSPKERSTIIPMITAWLTIASESLMETKVTDRRTWFFIDELHNLRKLPMLDTALAEIRKFGGCFVMGTQLISQLNVRYGHELTRAITGLCGTKVVMNVPEPITAKYMADFLGDKEEITTTETLSYGANTIRDGANIAQRYTKESTVSGSQIMNLTTGEAFVRFYGIPIVGKVMFKYHKPKISSVIEAKKITADEFYNKYENGALHVVKPELCGLKLTDRILSKPLCVYATDESWQKFCDSVRETDSKLIVFEAGSSLYERLFIGEKDILLNPKSKNGYSWNIIDDFKDNYLPLVEALVRHMRDVDAQEAREYLITIFENIDYIFPIKNSKDIFEKIISVPLNSVYDLLCNVLDINSDIKKYNAIRGKLKLQNLFLSGLLSNEKYISVYDYVKKDSFNGSVLFFSCFGDKNLKQLMDIMINCLDKRDILSLYDRPGYTKKGGSIFVCSGSVFKEHQASYLADFENITKNKDFQKIFGSYSIQHQQIQAYAKIYGVHEFVEIV